MGRWGAQTARALENFRISGEVFPLEVVHALAAIKGIAAGVNDRNGTLRLPTRLACSIAEVAKEIAAGAYDDEFVVDVFQTGSATSTNMNVNEVIATLVAERTGETIHPNDHVNASQSSNDVVPTALHLAVAQLVVTSLVPALQHLADVLDELAEQHRATVKPGRTHLMDAVPVTLGQELRGMARAVRLGVERIEHALVHVFEVPLGGTATGTGLNAAPGFADDVLQRLRADTGQPWRRAVDPFEAQGSRDAMVELSAMLRSVAISLHKAANDVRWMSSGPVAGLGELRLPALQAGSSIMPGKVNPVIPEVVLQVAVQVIGNDTAVALAGASGNFELNVMVPVIARNVVSSVKLLSTAARAFADQCLRGIEVDVDRLRRLAEQGAMSITALAPSIGYDAARVIVERAAELGRSVRDLVAEVHPELVELLDPLRLARPDESRPGPV